MLVMQAPTFEVVVWTAKSMEDMTKQRTADRKGRFSQIDPDKRNPGGNGKARWCEKVQEEAPRKVR